MTSALRMLGGPTVLDTAVNLAKGHVYYLQRLDER